MGQPYVIYHDIKYHNMNTVVSEIFAGRNFREFREKRSDSRKLSWVCIKWRPFVVRATWEQRAIAFVYACSEGIFSVPGLLTAANNLSDATAPNSLINMTSSNTALLLKRGHLQKPAILLFFFRKMKRQKFVSTINDSTLRSVAIHNT